MTEVAGKEGGKKDKKRGEEKRRRNKREENEEGKKRHQHANVGIMNGGKYGASLPIHVTCIQCVLQCTATFLCQNLKTLSSSNMEDEEERKRRNINLKHNNSHDSTIFFLTSRLGSTSVISAAYGLLRSSTKH